MALGKQQDPFYSTCLLYLAFHGHEGLLIRLPLPDWSNVRRRAGTNDTFVELARARYHILHIRASDAQVRTGDPMLPRSGLPKTPHPSSMEIPCSTRIHMRYGSCRDAAISNITSHCYMTLLHMHPWSCGQTNTRKLCLFPPCRVCPSQHQNSDGGDPPERCSVAPLRAAGSDLTASNIIHSIRSSPVSTTTDSLALWGGSIIAGGPRGNWEKLTMRLGPRRFPRQRSTF